MIIFLLLAFCKVRDDSFQNLVAAAPALVGAGRRAGRRPVWGAHRWRRPRRRPPAAAWSCSRARRTGPGRRDGDARPAPRRGGRRPPPAAPGVRRPRQRPVCFAGHPPRSISKPRAGEGAAEGGGTDEGDSGPTSREETTRDSSQAVESARKW